MQRKAQIWIFCVTGRRVQVLLLKRLARLGGHWQPVTGGVEPRERLSQGARRETFEETGFQFAGRNRLREAGLRFRFEGQWGRAEETVYWGRLAPIDGLVLPAPRLDPTEHRGFEWVTVPEALSRITFPAQRRGLRLSARAIRALV